MTEIERSLAMLRDAVRLAPDNLPLVTHYVRTLVQLMRYSEAERYLRDSLASRGESPQRQLLLAEVFYHEGKNSHSLAIIETLLNPQRPFSPALVLHAKLLYRSGNVQRAVQQYKYAVEHDESLEDPEFASLLGIGHDVSDDDSSWRPDDQDEVVDGRLRQASVQDQSSFDEQKMERPKITFENVGGMDRVKEEIRIKIIFPITHAEMFAAYGKQAGGGILMYGPPGCGKTYLARATAGEVNAHFLSIGINDVLDMWIGNSERNLRNWFQQARDHRPCVLFFDEVDALGASRSDMRQSAGRHLVNQFLAEMDGVQSNNDGVLILGATNAPWHVDSAFRRPGRFDRVLFVPPPDGPARVQILKLLLAGKPTLDIDLEKVAAKTSDFSGADLKAIVDAAIETKLHEAVRTGKPTPLVTKDLLATLKQVRATTREWFATARNHALYANQGGIYDDILQYLKL